MPKFDPKDFHLFAEVNGTLMSVGALDQPPEFTREGWGMGAISTGRETPTPRVVDAPIPDGISIPTLADARQLGEYVFIESRAGQRPAESWAFGVALHLGWKLERMYSASRPRASTLKPALTWKSLRASQWPRIVSTSASIVQSWGD